MLGISSQFSKLKLTKDVVCSSYQTIRWRKPLWMPTAKSKVFRIRPKRVIFPGEKEEVLRLYNNYRTAIKSLRSYFDKKYNPKYVTSTNPEELHRKFVEDFKGCVALNDEWNAQQRERREKYMAQELENRLARARQRVEEAMIKQEEKMEAIEEFVRKIKEEAVHFIKREDLDVAIDQALENEVDHNFALTLEGEKIIGRENNSLDVQKKNEVKQ